MDSAGGCSLSEIYRKLLTNAAHDSGCCVGLQVPKNISNASAAFTKMWIKDSTGLIRDEVILLEDELKSLISLQANENNFLEEDCKQWQSVVGAQRCLRQLAEAKIQLNEKKADDDRSLVAAECLEVAENKPQCVAAANVASAAAISDACLRLPRKPDLKDYRISESTLSYVVDDAFVSACNLQSTSKNPFDCHIRASGIKVTPGIFDGRVADQTPWEHDDLTSLRRVTELSEPSQCRSSSERTSDSLKHSTGSMNGSLILDERDGDTLRQIFALTDQPEFDHDETTKAMPPIVLPRCVAAFRHDDASDTTTTATAREADRHCWKPTAKPVMSPRQNYSAISNLPRKPTTPKLLTMKLSSSSINSPVKEITNCSPKCFKPGTKVDRSADRQENAALSSSQREESGGRGGKEAQQKPQPLRKSLSSNDMNVTYVVGHSGNTRKKSCSNSNAPMPLLSQPEYEQLDDQLQTRLKLNEINSYIAMLNAFLYSKGRTCADVVSLSKTDLMSSLPDLNPYTLLCFTQILSQNGRLVRISKSSAASSDATTSAASSIRSQSSQIAR